MPPDCTLSAPWVVHVSLAVCTILSESMLEKPLGNNMPPDGLLRSRSSSHSRHSSACMSDCSAPATTNTLDPIRTLSCQKHPLFLCGEVCCGCAEEEEEEMRVRMRQAQRQMKGTKLQYIDQQPILFSDVAGVPGAKVRALR